MSLIVVDASVAAKWFLPAAGETFTDEALGLLRRYAKGEVRFVVPDLFWAEFANILWKAVRQRRVTRTTAEWAVETMKGRKFPTVPSLDLLEEAFIIAATFSRSVYDGLYLLWLSAWERSL